MEIGKRKRQASSSPSSSNCPRRPNSAQERSNKRVRTHTMRTRSQSHQDIHAGLRSRIQETPAPIEHSPVQPSRFPAIEETVEPPDRAGPSQATARHAQPSSSQRSSAPDAASSRNLAELRRILSAPQRADPTPEAQHLQEERERYMRGDPLAAGIRGISLVPEENNVNQDQENIPPPNPNK